MEKEGMREVSLLAIRLALVRKIPIRVGFHGQLKSCAPGETNGPPIPTQF